jgi:hypothetical protein
VYQGGTAESLTVQAFSPLIVSHHYSCFHSRCGPGAAQTRPRDPAAAGETFHTRAEARIVIWHCSNPGTTCGADAPSSDTNRMETTPHHNTETLAA